MSTTRTEIEARHDQASGGDLTSEELDEIEQRMVEADEHPERLFPLDDVLAKLGRAACQS